MAQYYIGCSGFFYKHWKGTFYPEGLSQRKWFDYYCQHFKTLELNVTFYRFPVLSSLQNWYNKSPGDFKFSVKAPRLITHYKQFRDTKQLIRDFYDIIQDGLKEKLGCVLFQLPPRTAYTTEKLELIIKDLDPAFNTILEFRHKSWWDEHVYTELTRHQISFCGMSHPQLPDDIVQNTPIVYYRLHGTPELYQSAYPESYLKKLIKQMESKAVTKKAYIYLNNDIGGSAITNAKQLIELIK